MLAPSPANLSDTAAPIQSLLKPLLNQSEFLKPVSESQLAQTVSQFMTKQIDKLLLQAGVKFMGFSSQTNLLDKL